MAKSIVVFLALSICVAQCAVLRGKDGPNQPIHKRGKRSCHVCDDNSPPHHGPPGPPRPPGPPGPPPPPPPFFRTQQWSGLARSDNGQQGVFSGAAAAADLGNQASGQAFSVASSSAGGSGSEYGQSGSGSQSSANSGAGGQSGGNEGFSDQKQFSGSHSYKVSDYSYQSGGNKRLHLANHGAGGAGSGAAAGEQGFGNQPQNPASSGAGSQNYQSQQHQQSGGLNAGSASSTQDFGASGSERHEQRNSVGFEHGHGDSSKTQVQSAGNGQLQQGGSESHSSGSSSNGSQTSGDSSSGYAALNGALNLASEGLQTSQQTGCSTCGRSSYALSNAKSKTGNAVAVSIGG